MGLGIRDWGREGCPVAELASESSYGAVKTGMSLPTN